MTTRGRNSFSQARADRRDKNDARRILAERDKARSSTSGSARRWPFELLQNAHDPGHRDGSRLVDISITAANSILEFRHNGRPFTWDDLAALTTGGSTKEYESTNTSGRYGTGFLVTHALSPIIDVTGIVGDGQGNERFCLHLDRSGDEIAILRNMEKAEEGIGTAQSITELDDHPWTAEFSYRTDNDAAMSIGVTSVKDAAVFLFGTCSFLGRLSIKTYGYLNVWSSTDMFTTVWHDEFRRQERDVLLECNGCSSSYRIVRLIPSKYPDVGLLFILRWTDGSWEFVPAPPNLPKVFSRFPIRTATFLPLNCVIDGRFTDVEERDRIAMNESDQIKLEAALRLLPKAISLGAEENWPETHKLSKLEKVTSGFSEFSDPIEIEWWNSQLSAAARAAAEFPLVETERGFLPALSEDKSAAHFILPRYSRAALSDELPEGKTWKVASDIWLFDPPTEGRAAEWNELSAGWEGLGVPVSRIGLKELATAVRNSSQGRIERIPTHENPRVWLARYFDVLGDLPPDQDCFELVNGLLPNQHGALCVATGLKRASGMTDVLKNLALLLKCDVRSGILDDQIEEIAASQDLNLSQAFLERMIPNELTGDEVIEECLANAARSMRDGEQVKTIDSKLQDGVIFLLAYLWLTRGSDAAQLAQRCPLVTREGVITHYTAKKIMGPVAAWPETARDFANIYPPSRILADIYWERLPNDLEMDLIEALAEWDIIFREPLFRGKRNEVDEHVLLTLSDGQDNVSGVAVKDETFSQVALFSTEVIQHCQETVELARLLLGFVLKYLAAADQSWHDLRLVTGKRGGNNVTLRIRGALWLVDLKRRSWVPMQAEGGNRLVGASQASLSTLLQEEMLIDNDAGIRFLVECFGFDALNLRLRGFKREIRNQIEEWLARLVQLGRDNPHFYDEIVQIERNRRSREEEKQRNRKQRNRKFGLAVQGAIQAYLTDSGMTVKVVDRGYDFDVDTPDDRLIEGSAHELAIGPYLVEVKATTSEFVCLTPAQAKVASSNDQFILCVVDLRNCTRDRLEQSWTSEDIEPMTRMVLNFRAMITDTHSLIDEATEKTIAIQNEAQLRYAVPSEVWSQGVPISEWVEIIAPSLER